MTRLKVACVQMRTGVSVDQNCDTFETFVRKSAAEGAQYVQTPEMTGLLERNRKAQFEKTTYQDDDAIFKLAASLAGELGIWLHVGSTAIKISDDKLANRAGLFSPEGDLITTYDKIHMFDVDLDNGESWRESSVYVPGESSKLVETPTFSLGMAICYDVRFPQIFREQALAGAQILTCPAAFTRQTGRAHWHTLLKARAIENGAFMIAAAQGGAHEDGRETYGHSLVIDPWGNIVAELDHEEPGYFVTEIDLEMVQKTRQKVPNLKNIRDFKLETISG